MVNIGFVVRGNVEASLTRTKIKQKGVGVNPQWTVPQLAQSELNLPIFVMIEIHPEMVFAIDGCNKHLVTMILFDDNFIDGIHQVCEPVFCFL